MSTLPRAAELGLIGCHVCGLTCRTGPGDDVQPGLGRQVEERGDVAPAVERPAAGGELVEVPREVDVHAGVPGSPYLLEAFLPLLARQPEVEQRRAQHDLRLTVDRDAARIQ